MAIPFLIYKKAPGIAIPINIPEADYTKYLSSAAIRHSYCACIIRSDDERLDALRVQRKSSSLEV
jgi:hypothetical protein